MKRVRNSLWTFFPRICRRHLFNKSKEKKSSAFFRCPLFWFANKHNWILKTYWKLKKNAKNSKKNLKTVSKHTRTRSQNENVETSKLFGIFFGIQNEFVFSFAARCIWQSEKPLKSQ